MTSTAQQWQQIIVSIQQEISCLGEGERQWIEQHLANIHQLQSDLHQLFLSADGALACQRCQGGCCENGNNHMTLVNALGGLLGNILPDADFTRSCPFMDEKGCTLTVEIRPFNCVTFICDKIEERFSATQCQQFYALERQLREHYLAFDQRYHGSSLRGLLIRSQRMVGSKFLARAE